MRSSERGSSAVEYALLVAAIVAVLLAWTGPLGEVVTEAFNPACQYVAGVDCEIG